MATVFSKRIIAYILDFFVVSAIMWLFSYILFRIMTPMDTYNVYQYFIYVVPVFIFVYFVLCEKLFGASVGKGIMNLQVKSKNGARISWAQSIVRNLTKIYWVPIIFDWLFGKVLNTDRILNNITRTTVVDDI